MTMPAAARFLDASNHPGLIVQGSPNVTINFFPAARATDKHVCLMPPLAGPHGGNPLAGGSKSVFINGLPAIRQSDSTGCGASIISGSLNVIIGG
jgi:uncharacterized Zn-binding protein involved in type VI secretion